MRRALLIAGAAALALATGGCSDQLGDRGGREGSPPDRILDVDYVEVYRNADNFPNVALVCVRGIAFATTSSNTPSVVRMPEWDARCPGARATATPTPVPATSGS